MKINRQQVYDKLKGRCAYCGRVITFKEMQVDHMHPKCKQKQKPWWEKNQPPEDINCIENLMPTCRKCNHYKRGDTVESFRMSMRDLHERLHKIYIVEVAVNFGMAKIEPFDGKFYFEKVIS